MRELLLFLSFLTASFSNRALHLFEVGNLDLGFWSTGMVYMVFCGSLGFFNRKGGSFDGTCSALLVCLSDCTLYGYGITELRR